MKDSEHRCPGSRDGLLRCLLHAVGVHRAGSGAAAATPPRGPKTSDGVETTGSGIPSSSASGADASIITQLQATQAQLASRLWMLQETEAEAKILQRSLAVSSNENRHLRHDLEEAVKLLARIRRQERERWVAERKELVEALKPLSYCAFAAHPMFGAGMRARALVEKYTCQPTAESEKSGASAGTGAKAAASTGDLSSAKRTSTSAVDYSTTAATPSAQPSPAPTAGSQPAPTEKASVRRIGHEPDSRGRDGVAQPRPSEPEAVRKLRQCIRCPGNTIIPDVTLDAALDAYDATAARLKEAEELLDKFQSKHRCDVEDEAAYNARCALCSKWLLRRRDADASPGKGET